jgi:hypothetical protein
LHPILLPIEGLHHEARKEHHLHSISKKARKKKGKEKGHASMQVANALRPSAIFVLVQNSVP